MKIELDTYRQILVVNEFILVDPTSFFSMLSSMIGEEITNRRLEIYKRFEEDVIERLLQYLPVLGGSAAQMEIKGQDFRFRLLNQQGSLLLKDRKPIEVIFDWGDFKHTWSCVICPFELQKLIA